MDNIIFAKKTEDTIKKYENKEFTEMDFNDFLKEAEEW